ncbi:hypothetical protein HY439_02620 [Candidatus Microgenomates bacterium]|nr:hypothetical protein [Candidatus Microgenomates bacterium]
MTLWRSWQYKNLTIFSLGLAVAFALSRLEGFHNFYYIWAALIILALLLPEGFLFRLLPLAPASLSF